jgi:hypothetical protein
MSEDNLKETGREAINQGLGDIDIYESAKMPSNNFDVKDVMGDIIMAEFDDCSEDGTEIERDGIFVSLNMTKQCWRSAKVIKVGPAVSPLIKIGDRIAFPNDKGIKTVQANTDGSIKNIIFINQERIFSTLEPKED